MPSPDIKKFERQDLQIGNEVIVPARIITAAIEADPILSYDPKPKAASLKGKIVKRDEHSARVEFDYGKEGKFYYVISLSSL